MRKDMSKVIVERPRRGGKWDNPRKGKHDVESLPKKESMKKSHNDRKSLNENLAPLRRFFESRVGKKWDKVFSEVCENLKLTSAVQKHVRDHIKDFVEINVYKDGKTVFASPQYGSWGELRNNDLYVDPENGILKRYKYGFKKTPYIQRTAIELFAQSLNNPTVKHVVENGKLYKTYFDKVTNKWSNKTLATTTHAKNDFSGIKLRAIFRQGYGPFIDIVKDSSLVDLTQSYWVKLLDLYNNGLKKNKEDFENRAKQSPFQVGVKVQFTSNHKDQPREGVIIEVHRSQGRDDSYNVLCDNQNIRLWPSTGFSIKKIE